MTVERARLLEMIASMVEQGQRIGASSEDIASNVLDRLAAAGIGNTKAAWEAGFDFATGTSA